jgi:hypothetical protein
LFAQQALDTLEHGRLVVHQEYSRVRHEAVPPTYLPNDEERGPMPGSSSWSTTSGP